MSKVLAYLGAAVRSGQEIAGVETGPEALRNSGVFNLLRDHYKVDVKDYGDIHETYSQAHPDFTGHQRGFKNLHILDPTLRSLS